MKRSTSCSSSPAVTAPSERDYAQEFSICALRLASVRCDLRAEGALIAGRSSLPYAVNWDLVRGQLAGTAPANRVLSPCINKLTARVNVFKEPTVNLPAVGGHHVVIPNIGVGLGLGRCVSAQRRSHQKSTVPLGHHDRKYRSSFCHVSMFSLFSRLMAA